MRVRYERGMQMRGSSKMPSRSKDVRGAQSVPMRRCPQTCAAKMQTATMRSVMCVEA